MNRFPDHARVLFIGDSITCDGRWIAHIYDTYLRQFPDADIRMFNAGISGGSMTSALEYYDIGNGDNYKPTHAVIMMGMNDIGRNLYVLTPGAEDFEDKRLNERLNAVETYEKKLREMAKLLTDRGVKLTFVAPTGFDESQHPKQLDMIGCDAGLEYLGELNRRLAAELGADFINLHAPMRFLNAALTMTNDDRVHPDGVGHACMARVFLAAQGLVKEPTVLTLNVLPTWDDLLPESRALYEADQNLRVIWNVDWLILHNKDLKTEAERQGYLRAYRPTAPGPYFEALVDDYLRLNGDREGLLKKVLSCVETCVHRG